jgi:hypothetical protein
MKEGNIVGIFKIKKDIPNYRYVGRLIKIEKKNKNGKLLKHEHYLFRGLTGWGFYYKSFSSRLYSFANESRTETGKTFREFEENTIANYIAEAL